MVLVALRVPVVLTGHGAEGKNKTHSVIAPSRLLVPCREASIDEATANVAESALPAVRVQRPGRWLPRGWTSTRAACQARSCNVVVHRRLGLWGWELVPAAA